MRIDILSKTIKSNGIEDNKEIITDPSLRLINIRMTDFDKFTKLPLSANLLCKLALKESISFEDLRKVIFNMHDKTLIDFLYTNPCGLRDIYELYITYGQEIPENIKDILKNNIVEKRADEIKRRIDHLTELLSASTLLNESAKIEIRAAIGILEDNLMDYMFPF